MPDFDTLARLAEHGLASYQVPGAVVGVWHDGVERSAAFGVTNVDAPVAVRADTLFLIASNTKPFTAATAMRLVEQGKLDLHAPLRRYVPELRLADPAASEAVTLWHCLTHTGGWLGDDAPDTGRGDDAIARAVGRMAELPQLTPLGRVWSYNNIAFTLAGRAIELAAGEPYEWAVQRLLLEPLGMERSFFFAEDAIGRPTAAGHNVVDGQPRVVHPWTFPRSANPMGGLISCLPDMLRWGRFNLGDGEGVLRPETMRLMQTWQAEAGSSCDAVGVAWMLWDVGGTRVVGHGGYAPGQMSAFRFVPGRDLALFVATNSDHGARLHGEVVAAFQREYLGVDPPPPRGLDLPRSALQEMVGRYTAVLDDLEIALRDDGLQLATTALRWLTPSTPPRERPPPTRLAVTAQDRLVGLDRPHQGARGEILRDEAGRIAWLRWGGRIHRRELDGGARAARVGRGAIPAPRPTPPTASAR